MEPLTHYCYQDHLGVSHYVAFREVPEEKDLESVILSVISREDIKEIFNIRKLN